jgi:hypothetical protein
MPESHLHFCKLFKHANFFLSSLATHPLPQGQPLSVLTGLHMPFLHFPSGPLQVLTLVGMHLLPLGSSKASVGSQGRGCQMHTRIECEGTGNVLL